MLDEGQALEEGVGDGAVATFMKRAHAAATFAQAITELSESCLLPSVNALTMARKCAQLRRDAVCSRLVGIMNVRCSPHTAVDTRPA